MKTIRAKRNFNGNYVIYIGTERQLDFGEEWDARHWMAKQIIQFDYKVSPKSHITADEITTYINKTLS